jgi:diguanylate cyclase (GGDEF)-like protein/PAS domain S-box-containing protein
VPQSDPDPDARTGLRVTSADVEDVLSRPAAWALDEASVVVFSVDTALVLRAMAGRWLRDVGFDPTDRIGRPFAETWRGELDLPGVARAAAVDGVAQRVDLVVGGRVLDVTFSPVRVTDVPGAPVVGALGVALDVTAERILSRRSVSLVRMTERETASGEDLLTSMDAVAATVAEHTGGLVTVRLVRGDTRARVVTWHPDPELRTELRRHAACLGVTTADDAAPILDVVRAAEQPPARAPVDEHLRDLPEAARAAILARRPTELLVWPLRGAAGLVGSLSVLVLDTTRPEFVDEPEELAFVGGLTTRAALRLDALRARTQARAEAERRERRARHLEVLAETSRLAQRTGVLGPDDTQRVAELTVAAVGGTVVLVETEGRDGHLVGLAAEDPGLVAEQRRVYVAGGLHDSGVWDLIAAQDSLVVHHVDAAAIVAQRGERWRRYAEAVDGWALAGHRLEAHGSTLGALVLMRARPFDEDEVAFVRDLADRLALAGHNRRLAAERDTALAERSVSEARFATAFDRAPVGMCLTGLRGDELGVVLAVNDAYSAMTGYRAEDLVGRSYRAVVHPDDADRDATMLTEMAAGTRTHDQHEKRYVRADGTVIWVRMSASVVHGDGLPSHVIGHAEDITARRAAESELARRALVDPLTGLANRHQAMDHLAVALRALTDRPGRVALLYADLDGFKDINDTWGHDVGDEVLAAVADRLARTVRPTDTPSRLGGDEFVVVCRDVGNDGELDVLVHRVLDALNEPVRLPPRSGLPPTVHIGASIGVALTTDAVTGPEDLLRQADAAMYEAKRRGRGRAEVFREDLARLPQARRRVEAEVREALTHGRLRLHYQPVVDLRTRRVVGTEALVRLQHPERGLLPPADFIDVVEDSDLARPFGEWVLGEACRQLARWQRRRDPSDRPLVMAVNVSGRQVQDASLPDAVLRAVRDAGVDAHDLCLEVTERSLLHVSDQVVDDLHALTGSGVQLAIDDFGTGYSSLTWLQRFPVDVLKIDRSFVAGLGVDRRETEIVNAVAALGHALGLVVVAEGIENRGQANRLREIGCPLGQGFHLGRPLPAEAVAGLVAD